VATFLIAPAARATLYWDQDSALGGSGTWDVNTTQNWSTVNAAGAPDSKWTPNDGTQDPAFNGATGYTVTIPALTSMDVDSLSFGVAAGNVKITGGTVIHISDPNNSIVMNSNLVGSSRTQIIETPISGTDITVVANPTGGAGGINAYVTLGPNSTTGIANTFTGDLIFGGAQPAGGLTQININNAEALPPTATVRMKHDLCQLLFQGGGAAGLTALTATFNNNIILNDSGSGHFGRVGVGVSSAASVITLGGVISGDADFNVELGNGTGQGTIVLANHETYTGNTIINTQNTFKGTLRLGIINAIPVGSALTVTRGNFDMAGFSPQFAGLNGNTNGWVSNTGGTMSTLTISGNGIGTFAGTIGANSNSNLPGSNDNEALVLASTNTGSLNLTGGGNSYNGGTTINGGKLFAANPAATTSATGVGPVTVNSGGTLGGNGSVGDNLHFLSGGNLTVNSGGHLQPGLRVGATIGTLTAFNAVTLNSGSVLDMELGAPAPAGGTSDQLALSNLAGNFLLTVPAAAASIGVNLSDPAGGAAGNGTYTLMTFQAGQYTGSSNASQFFTSSLPSPNSLNGATIAYHLADNSNTVQDGNPAAATRVIMSVTGGPNALVWTGTTDGTWNVGGTTNFINLGTNSASTFANNDNVTFNDTGANTNPINIAPGGVQPNVITVNNSTTTYRFSGDDIKGSSVGGGGGLVLGGTGGVTFDSNYTSAGPIISNKTGAGSVTFNGKITAATSLTVNGGTATLAGANTFSGHTTVNAGTLSVSGANATAGAGDVTVNAGHAAIAAGVLNAIADSATLTLLGGGTAGTADVGYIDLAAGINEQVASLVLGTTTFTSGTFGATGSSATNFMDEYFTGTGIITVTSSLPGDWNHDGNVNAADYVVWRKDPASNGNDPGGYITWRENFGTPSSGPGLAASVPEPASTALFGLSLLGMLFWRRRRSVQL
jgi:fibronectin-binding autotransporter adhesin